MSRRCIAVAVLALACGLSVACTRTEDKGAQVHKLEAKPQASQSAAPHEPEHEELPKSIKLTKAIIGDAKIQSGPAAKEVLAMTLTLPGEIVADPDKSARLSTPVAGHIVQVNFKEGSVVKKGQALAMVRVPEASKIRSAWNGITAKAAAARANAERLQVLAEKGLAAKQEALAAKAEADALEAEARGLSEQLGVLGLGSGSELALRAPVAGVVVTRDAVVGQPISSEQTIATIADLSEVWFLGRVFEKDLGRLQVGAWAEVQLNAYPKERFEGSIEYLGRQIDPVARTVTARIRLANRNDLLRIGLFGTARVSAGEEQKRAPVLVVPRSALTEIGGKPVVFVRHGDDDFEVHEVLLGESTIGKVEIVNGLREGEEIVTQGVFTLKSVVLKSTLPEAD